MKNKTAEKPTEGISCTVSQSRFHRDLASSTSSHEIDIKDLSITVGQKEILSHAGLHLEDGGHYVLVGRNGTGKSTILQALSERLIPGIPRHIKILRLDQEGAGASPLAADQVTVLEHVLRSDTIREQLLREKAVLSAAFEGTEDAFAPIRELRKLQLTDAKSRYEEASDLANYRSGTRGWDTRKEQVTAEKELAQSEARANEAQAAIEPSTIAKETSAAEERLGGVEAELAAMGADQAEGRAATILRGLGFKQDWLNMPFQSLSGGWRTRCMLAATLFQTSHVLLLDECTNFLDLPAIIWLQKHVQDLEKTVMIVTHDRDFADAVAEDLLVLRNQSLEHFHGNLSTYEAERVKYAKWMARMKEAQEKQADHMEKEIQANVRAAKQKGDDKKLKQAASRQKKLDDRMGLQVSAKGGRFKKNRDLAGYYLKSRAEIEVPQMDPPVKMVLPSEPPKIHTGGSLLSLEDVTFGYRKGTKPTLSNINLVIHPGSRTGLVGLNGAGKSTLLKLALGKITASSGIIIRSPRARVAYFDQHSIDSFVATPTSEPSPTALQALAEATNHELSEQQLRALLGGIGLSGRTVSDVPLSALSGGQKVRVALMELLVPHPPHLLVLDEVTSHLDADTVTALARSLREYQGALLVVTHDRYFMRAVVEMAELDEDSDSESDTLKGSEKEPGRVFKVANGGLKLLGGGMDEYEAFYEKKIAKMGG